jgi:Nitronate monooxygenase
MAAVLKTAETGDRFRGFESHALRHILDPIASSGVVATICGPELVISAWRAGGLGFLAAGYKSASDLDAQVKAVAATGAAFGVNLFAPGTVPGCGGPRPLRATRTACTCGPAPAGGRPGTNQLPLHCGDSAHPWISEEQSRRDNSRASRIRFRGVSAARRNRPKPAWVNTSRSFAWPAWAPRPRPTS